MRSIRPLSGLCLATYLASAGLSAQSQSWVEGGLLKDRFSPRMTFNSHTGSLVLFGGWDGSSYLRDTWVWDGNLWSQRSEFAQNSPPPRGSHALTHNSASGYTVLFGGRCGRICILNDLWRWDGLNWEELFPRDAPGSPPPRFNHDLVDEQHQGRLFLFGGNDGDVELGDTWVFKNGQWEEIFPPVSPSPRNAMRMAYDPVRKRVLLFGGWDGSTYLGDTWEWIGTTWLKRQPTTSPPARALHSMSFTQRGRIAVFGGLSQAGIRDDLWEWDGENWHEIETFRSPPKRSEHDMALDSQRQRLVLFGGWKGSSTRSPDETWELVLENQATVNTHGFACSGTAGSPALQAKPGNMPWVDDTYRLEVANLTSTTSEGAIGILGFSDRDWASQALPMDLGAFGAPGCLLLTSVDKAFALDKLGGRADWEIAIPNQATLSGLRFYLQVLVVDRAANELGVTVSNGLSHSIGIR